MSSSAVLDADASRPRSGILTPSSDGSLNRRDVSSPDGRTKKRADAAAMDHLLKPSISVKVRNYRRDIWPGLLDLANHIDSHIRQICMSNPASCHR